ncbi:adenosine receptor A2b-like [Diadema antillarum]|uniref:adenosine receptor A2b-like n=1 Tax=Diadema antillarum TaxID=105358 RepID=UPI003A851821
MDSVHTSPVDITAITPLNTALLLTCLIPVVACSVVGNGLVVFAVYRYHRLWTPTYFIIASLSVADFFTGLVGIPLYLYFNLSRTTRCDSFEELVFAAPLMSVASVSLFHITIVSVDRYIAVTRPLRYVTLVTTRRVQVVIVFSWILLGNIISLAINSAVNPIIYGYRDRLIREALNNLKISLTTGIELWPLDEAHQPVLAQFVLITVGINSAVNPLIYGYRDRFFREAFSDTAQVVCITIGNAIVILVVYRNRHLHTPSYLLLAGMAFSDFLMGIFAIPLNLYFNVIAVDLQLAVKQANIIANVRRAIQPGAQGYDRHDGRLKAVKTTSAVVGTFCACWTPSMTYLFLRLTTNMSKEMNVGTHLVGTISSAVNPLIYGYRNKNFRDAFRETIRCGMTSGKSLHAIRPDGDL